MKKIKLILFFLIGSTASFGANVIDTLSADSVQLLTQLYMAKTDSLANSILLQNGSFDLDGGLAHLNTPSGFSYLDKQNAKKLLTDLWNNPEDPDILGVLVPSDKKINSPDEWAIVISYEDIGHVKDDDASDINYDDLLKQMQESTIEANKVRMQQGFDTVSIIGWAQKPFYDATNHKLHWAKEARFGSDEINTLNYNIRILGRRGVLVLNVVASINDLQLVKQHINNITASCDFISGNKYDDFNSSTDKIAEYGVAGLIAGGVMAKAGLFAKIGFFLLKLWKIIAIALVGTFSILRKKIAGLFKRKEQFVLSDEQKKDN